MSYKAKFEVKQFVGYALWWVRVRTTPKQRWADATLYAGRTDTEIQAWGQVAWATAGIALSEMRSGTGDVKWPEIRDYIRLGWPGEPQRQAGAMAWSKWPGDRAALATAGQEFRRSWQEESQRRDREAREAGAAWLAWMVFCNATGWNHLDEGPEGRAAFARWQSEKAKSREREQQERQRQAHDWFEQFRRQFVIDRADRASDLAVLGLTSTAADNDIKAAWRRLAMCHHPDRGGDHEQFTRLKAAYERLSRRDAA